MFNPLTYENSRGDGIAVLEVIGEGEDEQVALPAFVPLQRSELTGVVTGPLADLCLTHVFSYSRAVCERVLEAAYRFPLPGDAAVRSVKVRFGQTVIEAGLKSREEAEHEYAQARQEGRQAALATREAANVFTLLVTGLQPDEEIVVETRYVQLARTEGLIWSLRVPLTTAPRYVRRDERSSPQAKGQPLAVLRDPGHRFTLDVRVAGACTVASPTHTLIVEPTADGVRVRLRDGEVLPDRDCVLTWQPAQDPDQPLLLVLAHDDPASDAIFFVAHVAPPSFVAPEKLIPREVTLLVDHSGSMRGPKWAAADWAVTRFADELTAQDYLGLGIFHSVARWYRRQVALAEPATVRQALMWLANNQDSGGTELGAALEQALLMMPRAGEHARHVLVITDAQVTDASRVLRLADQEAGMKLRRRISVLCIDAAPNAYLSQELAERGGGLARFLTSAPDEEDISTALDNVLMAWAAPVLTGMRLAVDRMGVQAAGRTVMHSDSSGWEAIDLGDLPVGSGVWVAGRAPRMGGNELAFRLQVNGDTILTAQRADAESFPAIKACFGARQINALEHLTAAQYTRAELAEQLTRLGYHDQEVLGDAGQETAEVLRKLLMCEALEYGVMSSETAFVATRQEAGQSVEGSVPVANALPEGWSDVFVTMSMPSQAAPAAVPAARSLRARSSMFESSAGIGRLAQLAMNVLPEALAPLSGAGSPARERPDAGVRRDRSRESRLFSGSLAFSGPEAVLYDSAIASDKLPGDVTFALLSLVVPASQETPPGLDGQITLLLFVGDLAQPRAKIRLADLIRQGKRPLNVVRRGDEPVRLVLQDPGGTLAVSRLQVELWIGW